MITRAQAEALLTLAESLEACERNNIRIDVTTMLHLELSYADSNSIFAEIFGLSGWEIRRTVNENVPGGKFTANLIQGILSSTEDAS